MNRAVFLIGPTASGKSNLAVELAKRTGAEIISADSMQIYRGLDIGTAKIKPEEMQGIPHHLLDIRDPGESFNVQEYQQMARAIIRKLQEKDLLPIIAGGTGLYLQSLLYDLDFSGAAPDPGFRKAAETLPDQDLYRRLQATDPKLAQNIHPHNRKRILRALEIRAQGKTQVRNRFDRPARSLEPVVLGLEIDRALLLRRIEARVDRMLAEGLVEECRERLLPLGRKTQAAAAIGYSETLDYLRGLCTWKEMRENIIVHTRQYAKRQMTWFRRLDAKWLPHDTPADILLKELI